MADFPYSFQTKYFPLFQVLTILFAATFINTMLRLLKTFLAESFSLLSVLKIVIIWGKIFSGTIFIS
jgi:hypothetical protein